MAHQLQKTMGGKKHEAVRDGDPHAMSICANGFDPSKGSDL